MDDAFAADALALILQSGVAERLVGTKAPSVPKWKLGFTKETSTWTSQAELDDSTLPSWTPRSTRTVKDRPLREDRPPRQGLRDRDEQRKQRKQKPGYRVVLDQSSLITSVSQLTWDAEGSAPFITPEDKVGRIAQLADERARPGINEAVFGGLLEHCDSFILLPETLSAMEVIERNHMGPMEKKRLAMVLERCSILGVHAIPPPERTDREIASLVSWLTRAHEAYCAIETSELSQRLRRETNRDQRRCSELLEWLQFRMKPMALMEQLTESRRVQPRHLDLLRTALQYEAPLVTADENFVKSVCTQCPALAHTPWFITHPSRSSVGL